MRIIVVRISFCLRLWDADNNDAHLYRCVSLTLALIMQRSTNISRGSWTCVYSIQKTTNTTTTKTTTTTTTKTKSEKKCMALGDSHYALTSGYYFPAERMIRRLFIFSVLTCSLWWITEYISPDNFLLISHPTPP